MRPLDYERARRPVVRVKALRVSWLAFALTVAVLGLRSAPAQAYAWMMKHGFAQCRSCHVDPMGGETLTGMGRLMGETKLPMPWGEGPSSLGEFAFGVPEPPYTHLGGSLRGMTVTSFESGAVRAFPMQADLYGALRVESFTLALSVGAARASERYEHASKARLIGPIEERELIAVSRHHWLGVSLSDGAMLRAGRLNLPFGIRMPEHTLWVRSETLTDRESDQLHGVSFAYSSPRWRGELMACLGNFQVTPEGLQQRGYSGHLEYLLDPDLGIGISSLVLGTSRELAVDRGAVVRQAHGLTARYALDPKLVVLAEADLLARTDTDLGYVGMAMLDYELVQGLHFALTGELLNRGAPDTGATRGRGENLAGGWLTVNWFFGPHFDVRLDFVLRQERPATLLGQLHFYL